MRCSSRPRSGGRRRSPCDSAGSAGRLSGPGSVPAPTLVLATQWPVAAQLKWEHYHDQLIATRGKLTPAQADSAFQAGTVRLFQHILIRIPQSAVPMVEQQKEKEASAVLMQAAARRGFNFAQLARRYSEDPGSKSKGGYLPATPRGQFVPAFDSAAWALPA